MGATSLSGWLKRLSRRSSHISPRGGVRRPRGRHRPLAVEGLETRVMLSGDTPVAADVTLSTIDYPVAERSGHVDTYFGTAVPDPYRWLEDPADPRTAAWVEAESNLTDGFLRTLPTREARAAQMAELLQQPSLEQPRTAGGHLFWRANDGVQAQSVLFVSRGGRAEGRVLLDPNTLSADGTISLAAWYPSPSGRHVAWAASDGGSDWNTWRIRDVRSGRDLPERIEWSKFSGVAWTSDGRGFFYSRYPEPADPLESSNANMAVYHHRLGTPVAGDVRVFDTPEDPALMPIAYTARGSGRVWLDLASDMLTNTLAYVVPGPAGGRVRHLPTTTPARYEVIAQDRFHAWVYTTADAPNGRLVRVDLRRPDPANWREVIADGPDGISGVAAVGSRFVVDYLDDAASRLEVFTRSGRSVGGVALPGFGSVRTITPRGDSPLAFVSYTSFTQPAEVLSLDVGTRLTRRWYAPPVPFDSADFVTEQIWATSRDGTRVPAFVSRLRSLAPTGDHPTWLFGYGGFNISLTPSYSADAIAWMQRGGVYVVATLRGGGEFGETWHEAGTKFQKQNVFDDFIAVAEWLVTSGWTTADRLAANGRSNGGLLAGAMLTQRPDLFGAVVPEVGVLDMLRYHDFTIGYAWAGDYGRSDDSEEMFRYLRGYSPLHNVRAGANYPATLVMTAERDDRVVPAHSYKFAAALQHAQPQGPPLLIRIERRAGHGSGASLQQRIDMSADRLAFLDAHLA
jgi:prolyl oligopeptidase